MEEHVRIKLIELDSKIKGLQDQRELILSTQDLTTKEHYEFYHG